MKLKKGNTVKLSEKLITDKTKDQTAKVVGFVYDKPEGERGVRLDKEIAHSQWWMEDQLQTVN